MVPSEDEECVGELGLVAEEEADALQALLPAIHVVSKEQEAVRLRRFPVLVRQAHGDKVSMERVSCCAHRVTRRHLLEEVH